MKKAFLVCLFLAVFSCTSSKDEQDKLMRIIAAYENFEAYDAQDFPLGDFSEERFERSAEFWTNLKEQLQQIDTTGFGRSDQISFELLNFELQNRIQDFTFKTHWNPILSDAGFHNNLVYRVKAISTAQEAEDYLKVLQAIPLFVTQHIALLRKGLEAGNSQPLVIFQGYASTYEQHINIPLEKHFYYQPFQSLPVSIDEDKRRDFQARAKTIIQENVIPSFQKIKSFFESEYYPKTKKEIGLSETSEGKAYYKNRIAYYTTLPLTAQEIHTIGLEEVKKIRSKMEGIIAEVAFSGSFSEFLTFLRTDPQFYAKTPDELLTRARDISKRLDEQLPRFFSTLPRTPYGVAPVPDAIAPKYTGGRYIPTALGSTRPGYYWVNTYNLPSRPLYVLPALSAHEAVPGHHLQMALNAELPSRIPQFRRNLYLSAYGEGWGLYTEELANEMGIYTSPYERFGQLTYAMWRACRLVVDTGIHAFGWSREEAVDFMAKNTALSLHEVNTEVDRYISWPGQALSYKIGELKIKELRRKAEQTLGEKFDIRDFHEVILKEGTLTLPLMEAQVEHYIAQKRNE